MKSTVYAISPAARSAPPCWGSAVAKPEYRESAGPLYECAGGDRPPPSPSTDAPCSALSVIYTDEGEFDSYLMLPRTPTWSLSIRRSLPARRPACWPPGLAMRWLPGSKPAPAPVAAPPPWRAGSAPRRRWRWPSLCLQHRLEEGEKAMLAARQHVVTRRWAGGEANTYLSGVGFERVISRRRTRFITA